MVCASAAEINCSTDLEVMINLDQINLVSALCTQLTNLTTFETLVTEPEEDDQQVNESIDAFCKTVASREDYFLSVSSSLSRHWATAKNNPNFSSLQALTSTSTTASGAADHETDITKDSGVDFELCSAHSTNVPVRILLFVYLFFRFFRTQSV